MPIALPLLATGLGDLFVSVAVFLIVFAAAILIAVPIKWAVSQIPIVGPGLVAPVDGFIVDLQKWAQGQLGNVARGVTNVIAAPAAALQYVLSAAALAITTLGLQTLTIVNVIARPFLALQTKFYELVASNQSNVAQLIRLAFGLAVADLAIGTIRTTTIPAAQSTAIAAAGSYTDARVGATAGVLAGSIATSAATAKLLISEEALRARLAEAAAVTAADAAVGIERNRAIVRENAIAAKAGVDIGALETQVGTLIGEVTPIAAAGVVATVAELTRFLNPTRRNCIDSTCSILGDLQSLVNVVDDLALFGFIALIAEGVRDPRGATATITAEVNGVRDAAEAIAGPLFGIA